MIVREAAISDEAQIVALAEAANAESTPWHIFDGAKLGARFRAGFSTGSPAYFVAVRRGEVVGFMRTYAVEYEHTDGFFTVPETTFVRPDLRGSRAAALLFMAFVRWSDKIGAKESPGGNSNGMQRADRNARFMERFGFEIVGYCMRRPGSGQSHVGMDQAG